MTHSISNADKIVRCTVMIEATAGGTVIGTGSGLLMIMKLPSPHQHLAAGVVVTNKHVVDGADSVRFTLSGNDIGQKITSTSPFSAILYHPEDDVDLCLIPVADEVMKAGFHKQTFLSSDDIFRSDRLQQLTAIESILMIGYPNGIIDQADLYPISRRGITATPAYQNFDGSPHFLIDCACFPGSSGSPVFLFDPQGFVDRENNVQLGTMRFGLVGFLYAGPVLNQQGHVVARNPPAKLSQMIEVPLMLNLGFCIRAEKLDDFIPLLKEVAGVG